MRMLIHVVANTGNFRELSPLVRLASDVEIPMVNVGHNICGDEKRLDRTLWNIKAEYNSEFDRAEQRGRELGVTFGGRKFFMNESSIMEASRCVAPFEATFVEMPGTVSPCCFMGRDRMGNVYEDDFEAVWFGEHSTKLRHARSLPACQVCTVFTPFDDPISQMSAFLTTRQQATAASEY